MNIEIDEKKFLKDLEQKLGFRLTPEQKDNAVRILSDAKTNAILDIADSYLDQAEIESKKYAQRRNAGFSGSSIESTESVRTSIRDWLRRSNKVIKG